VVVRMRPFIENEKQQDGRKISCVKTGSDLQTLSLVKQDIEQRDFKFDQVLDVNSNQD
jgi:hypothetical protein